MGKILGGDLRWFLRLVFPEPEPGMEERMMEMYREWFRENQIALSSERGTDRRSARILPFPGVERPTDRRSLPPQP